jgi:DNA-binding response OmpR family regulator
MMLDAPAGHILLVEDDEVFAEELGQYLAAHGIRTEHARTTDEAMESLLAEQPLGVILDQFVGETDTLVWFTRLRTRYSGGVMFLSANQEITDRIVGLEMGAADFVSKTTMPREILARVRSLIRRPPDSPAVDQGAPQPSRSPKPGHWYLDSNQLELFRPDGAVVHLTGAEFETLRYLDNARGRTVSRDELVKAVLRRNYSPLDRSIDNVISRLRKKLDTFEHAGRRIKAVRGGGYIFVGFNQPDAA